VNIEERPGTVRLTSPDGIIKFYLLHLSPNAQRWLLREVRHAVKQAHAKKGDAQDVPKALRELRQPT
jgi:hypothetical protein